VALPLALVGLVVFHILALHEVGSNNPDGVNIKEHKDKAGKPKDGIPFHPYYTVKDTFGLGVFLIFFSAVVFFAPEMGGMFLEPPNFEPANPLQTPEHIAPVWYFTAFYSILRAIPDKFGGVLAMGSAIFLLFLLPWIDRGRVRSVRYRGLGHKIALGLFAVAFVALSYLGLQAPSDLILGLTVTAWAQIWTVVYFGFFAFLFAYTAFGFERTKPVPERVTD